MRLACGFLGRAGGKAGIELDWRGLEEAGFYREEGVSTVCTGGRRLVEKWVVRHGGRSKSFARQRRTTDVLGGQDRASDFFG